MSAQSLQVLIKQADLDKGRRKLSANPYQVAARLDHWRFGPTVALTVASLPVQRFRQVKPRVMSSGSPPRFPILEATILGHDRRPRSIESAG